MPKKRWLISIGAIFLTSALGVIFFSPLITANKEGSYAYSGIVQQTEVDLSFKVGGRLAELLVDEGTTIEKGQILARLEQGEWQAKVEQGQAAVEMARANVDKALLSVGLTEHDGQAKIEQAQAAIHIAQAKYEALLNGPRKEEISQLEAQIKASEEAYLQAQENMKRSSALYEEGAVPQAKVDESKVQLEQAKAQHTNAQLAWEMAQAGARPEELAAAKSQVEQARAVLEEALNGKGKVTLNQADVRLASAQLRQAEANLQEAEVYLSYTTLSAPVQGLVTGRYVNNGEMINTGVPIVTIADTQDKWVVLYIPEQEISQVELDQELELYLPALDRKIGGKVVYINPAPQFAVKKATNYLNERDIRTFAVKVQLLEDLGQIYAGMTAEWVGVKP